MQHNDIILAIGYVTILTGSFLVVSFMVVMLTRKVTDILWGCGLYLDYLINKQEYKRWKNTKK